MCGRYSLVDVADLASRFGAKWINKDLSFPRFNIAPTQCAPIIWSRNIPYIEQMRWGLAPETSKPLQIRNQIINIRAETVVEKFKLRNSLNLSRCLVAATGYYEWQRYGNKTVPFYFRLKGGEVFALAGFCNRYQSTDGRIMRGFTIVTTEANDLVRQVHRRMPVILSREDEQRWLELEIKESKKLEMILRSFPDNLMEAYRVSAKVNYTNNDSPDLINPVERAETIRLPGF